MEKVAIYVFTSEKDVLGLVNVLLNPWLAIMNGTMANENVRKAAETFGEIAQVLNPELEGLKTVVFTGKAADEKVILSVDTVSARSLHTILAGSRDGKELAEAILGVSKDIKIFELTLK